MTELTKIVIEINENGEAVGVSVPMTPEEATEHLALSQITFAPVFPNLSPSQFRLGLFSAGLLDLVDSAIEVLPEPDRTVAKIQYEYAPFMARADPWVSALAGALELTEQQVDDLWLWAAQA